MKWYIGAFPPPYGGVTVKNQVIYDWISQKEELAKFDLEMCGRNVVAFMKLFLLLFCRNRKFIIGAAGRGRKIISMFLYYFNKKGLNKAYLIVMGGGFPDVIKNDLRYQKYIKEYEWIYVETEGMKLKLEELGINKVKIFPNCRKPFEQYKEKKRKSKPIKLLFFSQISEQKGVDNIFSALNILEERKILYSMHFYGEIVNEYKKTFYSKLNERSQAVYKGICKEKEEELYQRLSGYDVLLFPTKWKVEGIPGILVETKAVGLPVIASGNSYNKEIIREGEGIIMEHNTALELAEAIGRLAEDSDLLIRMNHCAYKSFERYNIINFSL